MDELSIGVPVPADHAGQLASLAALSAIPEEEIWLASQKSARTRRAYRQVESGVQSSIVG